MMGWKTPRKRSDGRIDYKENFNTELKFDGAPDPRLKELSDGDGNTVSDYDRGEDSVINPFDTHLSGQSLDAPKQMKIAAGRDTGGGSNY